MKTAANIVNFAIDVYKIFANAKIWPYLRTVCCHTEQNSTLAVRILESESLKQALPAVVPNRLVKRTSFTLLLLSNFHII